MSQGQPTPTIPPELWRWEGAEKGWVRLDEPLLPWYPWTPWTVVAAASPKRRPLNPPILSTPGVYEIRRTDASHLDERLYIGYGGDLATRIHNDLMRDDGTMHKKAEILKAVNGDQKLLELRWVHYQNEQEAYLCEQYLSCRYFLRFGRLPDFVEKIG